MVASAIELNHVALLALTGSALTGVFQTLSAGKAGHLVPGSIVPAELASRREDAFRWTPKAPAMGMSSAATQVSASVHATPEAHRDLLVGIAAGNDRDLM